MSKFKLKESRPAAMNDIDRELNIDDTRLNEEIIDQPLYFKKYSTMLAECARKAKFAKLVLEETKAAKTVQFSTDGAGRKVKEVEAAVTLDADVQRLERELLDAEELQERFQGIVKAFYQRHEMLKDLAANRRKELID